MADQPFSLTQAVFKAAHPDINVIPVHINALTERHIAAFIKSRENDFVGVAGAYGPRCALVAVAFATPTEVLLVRFSSSEDAAKRQVTRKNRRRSTLDMLQDALLCHSGMQKLSFNMDRLATSLFLDQRIRLVQGIDIQSAVGPVSCRQDMPLVFKALGGKQTLHASNVAKCFGDEKFVDDSKLAIRAWASYHSMATLFPDSSLRNFSTVDTKSLDKKVRRSWCTVSFTRLMIQR
ncbi:hypothetical protein OE88DRAFT_1661507 [Heliocybe sulcata]|uniref:3'-5' exonuclease domain-containing protein n=1 Tax=Heliocybe sulcata TaxID=5364 RepID=A0A5C3MZ28_9AGAM|nr:hypothetical protein OE88DRAFT_1661507 [Heliocybe sulcata]